VKGNFERGHSLRRTVMSEKKKKRKKKRANLQYRKIFVVPAMGILEHVLEMSLEVNFVSLFKGISFCKRIKCTVFFYVIDIW